ncbi:hypothetical protein ACFQ14_05595 [Pseudahrensia aquimaris]|uniref:Terminase small subunit n=1 Tax=Pseudahrensia aquimaris TaxID=744461 RepID=A0ABW3FFZ4_9HYPH
MPLSIERSAVARTLFERFAVPHTLIAAVAGWKEDSVRRLSKQQGWRAAQGIPALKAHFSDAYQRLLKRIDNERDGFTELEKAARTMIAMSKTLESLAAVETKMPELETGQASPMPRITAISDPATPQKVTLDADNIQRFNAELEALVAKIEQEEAASQD